MVQGKAIRGILDKVSWWWAVVAAAATFVMMIIMVADALGRKIVGSIPGAYETAIGLMVVIMFLSQGYAQMKRAHVSVEILAMRLSVKAQAVMEGTGAFLGVAVFGLITWLGFAKAWEATVNQEFWYGIVDYPMWIFRWFVPLGAGILTAQLLYTVCDAFGKAMKRQ